jgi:hypothetical protein
VTVGDLSVAVSFVFQVSEFSLLHDKALNTFLVSNIEVSQSQVKLVSIASVSTTRRLLSNNSIVDALSLVEKKIMHMNERQQQLFDELTVDRFNQLRVDSQSKLPPVDSIHWERVTEIPEAPLSTFIWVLIGGAGVFVLVVTIVIAYLVRRRKPKHISLHTLKMKLKMVPYQELETQRYLKVDAFYSIELQTQ